MANQTPIGQGVGLLRSTLSAPPVCGADAAGTDTAVLARGVRMLGVNLVQRHGSLFFRTPNSRIGDAQRREVIAATRLGFAALM